MTEGVPGVPEQLGIIAGRGIYPLQLAEEAKAKGVRHIHVVAFRHETRREISRWADQVDWLYVGQFKKMLALLKTSRARQFVMAGQITPRNLFFARPDAELLSLLKGLPEWNAHSIFGQICERIEQVGVELVPASRFMEQAMPAAGVLTRRGLTDAEAQDVALGFRTAKATSALNIGQTVVVQNGVILAVEGFEGTDKTIARAGKLGSGGRVVVKVAKEGHDMRFDIPVIGTRTVKTMRGAGVTVLAVEAERTILLDRTAVIQAADQAGITITAVTAAEMDGTE